MNMPRELKQGDKIRVIAPSGCFAKEIFLKGIEFLREQGFLPLYQEDIFNKHGGFAGNDHRRLEELQNALKEPDSRAIWIARGGYGATRLLDYLDEQLIRQANKYLIGFSDTTALHALWHRADICSIHGPNITTIPKWTSMHQQELLDFLIAPENPKQPTALTYHGTVHTFDCTGKAISGKNKTIQAPLFGGNLTVLTALVGTPFFPNLADHFVFLEDINEEPYRLDRALTQLRQAGAFVGVAGFLLGQFTRCEKSDPSPLPASLNNMGVPMSPPMSPMSPPISSHLLHKHHGCPDDRSPDGSQHHGCPDDTLDDPLTSPSLTNTGVLMGGALATILHNLAEYYVPIISDLPIGHEDSSRVLPLGFKTTINTGTGQVTIHKQTYLPHN